DLVAHARQVLHPASAHEHHRVLLQVVALARDVAGDLHAVGQPHARDLAQRRVRLLRRDRLHAGADAAPLRGRDALLAPLTGLQARGRDLLLRWRAALAHELVDAWHAALDGGSGVVVGWRAMATLDSHRGGSGEPLVLVHGLGHTWRGWKPMLPLLEPRFDVLAVDLPGFGRSAPLPEGVAPTAEALADAVESELDAAGFDTAHLAG